jgi:hypothetical protein
VDRGPRHGPRKRAQPHGGLGRNEPPLARTPGADILLLNQLRGKLFAHSFFGAIIVSQAGTLQPWLSREIRASSRLVGPKANPEESPV